MEHGKEKNEAVTNEGPAHVEGSGEEGGDHSEIGEAPGEKNATREASHNESGEEVLGVKPDSAGLVVLAVAVSVGLAILALLRPSRPLLLATAIIMVVFAVFDVAELVHQLDVNRNGIALVAGFVAALHLLAAGAAVALLDNRSRLQVGG